eukprot:TRINITY_DN1318_c0_g1_i4.p1 TRINITY_DN1318_c0_g1~~TRINITY_DN1318_c0_g1_i4.p1  ORF type:complete len:333 (-),score=116.07 TRINITY_DN1318_c0_g1_i4:110-1108(-)
MDSETKTETKNNAKEVYDPQEETSFRMNCRMYEQQYPEVDDYVIVEVRSIEEMGAYVALKEYNDIEGMILLSELSRRRIRSINKIIRVGRLETVVVLRVDPEKGYIDLSKRRVSEEDAAKCEEKYNKSKAVHSIMRNVAEQVHEDPETLYQKVGWPLYKKYGHAYDAFKTFLTDPDTILQGLDVTPEIVSALRSNIKRRLTPLPVRARTDIEVTCFSYEGIDAIRRALKKGEATSLPDAPIKVKLVAPPLYVVFTTAPNKDTAFKCLEVATEAIKAEILANKGNLVVKVPPTTFHEREEREMQSQLEMQAKKVDQTGGEDSSGESGSGSGEE